MRRHCAISLDARIRIDEPAASPVPLPFDSRLLATVDIWNLTTRFGKLNLVLRPDGFERGFDDLSPGATRERVGETLEVMVASVDQLIVSKEAAGRAKDREAVAELRHVRSLGRDPQPPGRER